MAARNRLGVTLIELIAALLLLGILAAAMGKGVSTGVQGFIVAKENMAIAQKAQAALLRLTRELKELNSVAAIESTPLLIYDKLDGRHAIAATGNTVKLYDLAAGQASVTPDFLTSGGHILVDQVERLILSFHAGDLSGQTKGVSTWTTSDPLTNLSAIGLQLTLTRPSDTSQTITFETLVHPRNINSYGGAIPAPGPNPPTRYAYCFISTIAGGSHYDFWKIMLFGAIVSAILSIAELPTLRSVFTSAYRKPGSKASADERGAALIWIIMTLLLFGALIAALVPMISASRMSQVAGTMSDQVNLLAESGYRFAAGRYLNAATDAEENSALFDLHRKTYLLADNAGQFTLSVFPYFFEITAPGSDNTIAVRVPGGLAPDLAENLNSLAEVRIGSQTFPCNLTWTPSSETGVLSLQGEAPAVESGSTALMAARSAAQAQTITSNGDLFFYGATGDAFPEYNGRIIINEHIYTYRRNDRLTHRLVGVADPADPNASIVIPADSPIILLKYIDLKTEGRAGSGSMQTARTLTYHTPLPITEPIMQPREWLDAFNDMSRWRPKWGSHAIEQIDGDNALRVTGTTDLIKNNPKASLIELDWSTIGMDLQKIRAASMGYLTYAAQVKIGFESTPQPDWGYDPDFDPVALIPKYYAAGLLFRLDAKQNCYGLSLMRGINNDSLVRDLLDDNLVPKSNDHLLVLWQATGDGQNKRWLAYKRLDPFYDDAESISTQWSFDPPWAAISNALTPTLPIPNPAHLHTNSPSHSLHNIAIGNYANNTDSSAYIRSIAISSPCNVRLKFSQFYKIATGDSCRVEVSTDSGATWRVVHTIGPGGSSGWQAVMVDLGAFLTPAQIQLRFRLVSDSAYTADGWYVDDVALLTLPVHLSTLAVQVSEAATLIFAGGGPNEIQMGSVLSGPSGTGRVIEPPLLSNADWQGGNAAGMLRVEMFSGSFAASETISMAGAPDAATVQEFRARENLIRAFHGSKTSCGSGDENRFNLDRFANERLTAASNQTSLNWPPAPHEVWTAEADRFMQIQWDHLNPAAMQPYGPAALVNTVTSQEPNAVIRSWESALLIPASAVMNPVDRPEVGLHSFGQGAANLFFDDFGLLATTRLSDDTPPGPLME